MSTFMANKGNIVRKWYILDAAGKPLGKTAATAATLLRGKHKPEFTPNVDTGDHVVIINTDKVVLTGKKLEQKLYRRHSGKLGNLKEIKYGKLMAERSDFAVMQAIKGMLPKNSLGAAMLKKVRVYKGAEHEQQAQQPQPLTLAD